MCVAHGFAAVNLHGHLEHLLVCVKEMKQRSRQTGMSVQAQVVEKTPSISSIQCIGQCGSN